ncbi:mediator of RNA polymerase II transcription subunit [Striga asiatica]|uniref:Mediator of RNA polymerase II transcription subunit 25 n=1 Tax=Striga asiatica TaxID=4170 RepID=A0A5A7PBT2_STRAF|nr:mediator of RNA polymerase II transcription subunit [Striga asiatica]
MGSKKLIVAVEGTAAVGVFWQTIVSDYLDKIIRYFCRNERSDQKPSTDIVELSLVMFNTHGPYSACLVQKSGWTRDMDLFFHWLSALPFSGGGFDDAAIAEGLAEALMMFSFPKGKQTQNMEGERHCVLIAASNPYPLRTSVYRRPFQDPKRTDVIETRISNCLSDEEALARSFAQYAISLSIICPKQLPKLRRIYNAGKCDPRAEDLPVVSVKNPHFLVLISENFMEARSSLELGFTSFPSNRNPAMMDVTAVPPVSGTPPASAPAAANESVMVRSPISVGNMCPATVNQEPITFPTETTVASVFGRKTSGTTEPPQSKYVKVWEGNLNGQKQGQPVFIAGLEGYRKATASEMLAANWPSVIQIVRLVPQDYVIRQLTRKSDLIVFRALNQHGFLSQLHEKKLCAVIPLPSQTTLLLSVSGKGHRLIGMLLPDALVPNHQLQIQQQNVQQQTAYIQGAERSQPGHVSSQGPTKTMSGGSFMS